MSRTVRSTFRLANDILAALCGDLRDLAVDDVDAAVCAGGQRGIVGYDDHGLALVGDVAEDRKHLFGRALRDRQSASP